MFSLKNFFTAQQYNEVQKQIFVAKQEMKTLA